MGMNIKKGFLILITKKSIGAENGLGEKLLENFIYSLSDSIVYSKGLFIVILETEISYAVLSSISFSEIFFW